MLEVERRIGYNPYRILIDVGRILNPSFYDQGVYLTGAQVEVLRNISGYLHMRATFADEYHGTYYLMPDDSDWDAIQKVVADMEEKLSNNDNVIWGYNSRRVEDLGTTAGSDGTAIMSGDAVAAGVVLVIEAISWQNQTGGRGIMIFRIHTGASFIILAWEGGLARYEPLTWKGKITLAEGDYLQVRQGDCFTNDVHIGGVRGYRMKVPE